MQAVAVCKVSNATNYKSSIILLHKNAGELVKMRYLCVVQSGIWLRWYDGLIQELKGQCLNITS